jgi:hypothetical protein
MKANQALARTFTLLALWAGAGAALAGDQSRVQILSATVRDQKIAAATVILQRNGEPSSSSTTDPEGIARLSEAAAADPAALLIVRHPGYSDLIAKCPCTGMTYALSPTMEKLDGMRIVLNWGNQPQDLDGHLAFPGNHIFFRSQQGTDANLDVDHIDGYGPETITITRKHAGERYVYAVEDYTDKHNPDTYGLSTSHAKVFVYIGQTLIKVYYVPANREGNVWTVFAISGAGEVQDINTFSKVDVLSVDQLTAQAVFGVHLEGPQPNDRSAASISEEADNSALVEQSATSTMSGGIPPDARALNVQGETAYRSADYATAIRLFRLSIDQYAAYGQAYSNLGLAFQKSGRVAEALWANRKAIALAAGPHAAQTRAGTHFNNGRIYEDAHQWDDAMREYRAAQAEKANDVYTKAIERVHLAGAQ